MADMKWDDGGEVDAVRQGPGGRGSWRGVRWCPDISNSSDIVKVYKSTSNSFELSNAR